MDLESIMKTRKIENIDRLNALQYRYHYSFIAQTFSYSIKSLCKWERFENVYHSSVDNICIYSVQTNKLHCNGYGGALD